VVVSLIGEDWTGLGSSKGEFPLEKEETPSLLEHAGVELTDKSTIDLSLDGRFVGKTT
jgi:hypothetical protein